MHADKIITVSKRTKGLIVLKYGINPDKIEVVYNAVEKRDTTTLKTKETSPFVNDKIVLFLGRITSQKGPEYFLNAANMALKKVKNLRFIMAGSGDLGRSMIESVAGLDITDRFHFTGFLSPRERERLFKMADLYIMPSVSEPFGITPLEALEYEVPIIVSKQSGVVEVLENPTTVDFWDVEDLSKNIIYLLENPKEGITQLKNRSNVRVNVTWMDVAHKIKDIYVSYT